jgi:hypothetical protein
MRRLITICCAASMILAVAGLAAAKSDTAKAKWQKGWVSDSKCGVKGAGPGHVECGKKCLAAGEHAVFVDEHTKKVYTVDNEDAVKELIGHRVAVHATVDADKGSMHIDKVNRLPEKQKSTAMGDMH